MPRWLKRPPWLKRKPRVDLRLEAYLAALSRELEWHASAKPAALWIPPARGLLADAEAAAKRGEFDAAWPCALGVARFQILGYDRAEVRSARVALQKEAQEKLSPWRREAVLALTSSGEQVALLRSGLPANLKAKISELLDGPRTEQTRDDVAEVLRGLGDQQSVAAATLLMAIAAAENTDAERRALYMATLIRDDDAANVFRRMSLIRMQLQVLSSVLGVVLVGVMVMAANSPIDLTGPPTAANTWVWAALFGALGGCMTALASTSRRPHGARVPEQRQQVWFTAARPLVGSASALFAYVLLQADVVTIGPKNTGAGLLVLSFVAGFSERLVTGMVRQFDHAPPSTPPP